MAKIVFILIALAAGVRKLRELYVQTRGGWLSAGMYAFIARQGAQIVHGCSSSIEKKRADLVARPDLMMLRPLRECRYCAAMNRLLTSVVRPFALLERMK